MARLEVFHIGTTALHLSQEESTSVQTVPGVSQRALRPPRSQLLDFTF